jgi:hypothetical protein
MTDNENLSHIIAQLKVLHADAHLAARPASQTARLDQSCALDALTPPGAHVAAMPIWFSPASTNDTGYALLHPAARPVASRRGRSAARTAQWRLGVVCIAVVVCTATVGIARLLPTAIDASNAVSLLAAPATAAPARMAAPDPVDQSGMHRWASQGLRSDNRQIVTTMARMLSFVVEPSEHAGAATSAPWPQLTAAPVSAASLVVPQPPVREAAAQPIPAWATRIVRQLDQQADRPTAPVVGNDASALTAMPQPPATMLIDPVSIAPALIADADVKRAATKSAPQKSAGRVRSAAASKTPNWAPPSGLGMQSQTASADAGSNAYASVLGVRVPRWEVDWGANAFASKR